MIFFLSFTLSIDWIFILTLVLSFTNNLSSLNCSVRLLTHNFLSRTIFNYFDIVCSTFRISSIPRSIYNFSARFWFKTSCCAWLVCSHIKIYYNWRRLFSKFLNRSLSWTCWIWSTLFHLSWLFSFRCTRTWRFKTSCCWHTRWGSHNFINFFIKLYFWFFKFIYFRFWTF